jgi:hypothetical protein
MDELLPSLHCQLNRELLDLWVHLKLAKWLVQRLDPAIERFSRISQAARQPKELAVKRTDGSDYFLFMMRDVHITPHRPPKRSNPFCFKTSRNNCGRARNSVPDNPWNGRAEQNTIAGATRDEV